MHGCLAFLIEQFTAMDLSSTVPADGVTGFSYLPIKRCRRHAVRELLLDGRLPAILPTERVEVRRIHILAGHPAGRHVHNGPVFGSIVEGSVLLQVEGEAKVILRPGDVFFEPAGVPIAHFDALEENVTFLAYFPLTAGQQPGLL